MGTPFILALALVLSPVQSEADEQYQFIVGLCEKGLNDMAVREAQRFLSEHPDHPRATDAHYRLAGAWFELGRFEEAAPGYRALSTRTGFDLAAEAAFRLGQCELELGHFGPAASAFERAGTSGGAYLRWPATTYAAEARLRAGEVRSAERSFKSVLESADETAREHHATARWGLAWCAFQNGVHAECAARSEEFLRRHAEHELAGEVAFLAGESYLELGDTAGALKAFARVPEGPRRTAALRGTGFALAESGDARAAATAFRELLELEPDGPYASEAALSLGVQLLTAGEVTGARAALADERLAQDPEAIAWRARAELADGDGQLALKSVLAGLEIASDTDDRVRLQVTQGDVLTALGRHAEAAEAWAGTGDAYARHAACVALVNAGQYELAVQSARAFLKDFPRPSAAGPDAGAPESTGGGYRTRVELALGEALFGTGQLAEAESVLTPVAEQEVDGEAARRARVRLAWCRYRAGRPDEARAGFSAIASSGDGPAASEAQYMLGVCARDLGDDDLARTALERYLERWPEGPERAAVLLALGELSGEAGAGHLEELLRDHAGSSMAPAALLVLGDRCAEEGDPAGARAAYQRLLADHPGAGECTAARYGLAWLDFEAEDWEAAAAGTAAVVATEGVDPELYRASLELSVWAAERLGRPEEALTALRELVRSGAGEERAVAAARTAARAFVAAGRGEFADKLWRELAGALESDVLAAEALVERAWIALESGRPGEALARVKEALARSPEEPGALEAAFFVGEAHSEAGEDEASLPAYGLATAPVSPLRAEALYKRGFVLLRLERAQEAAQDFRNFVELYETSPYWGECLFLWSEALYRAGDLEGARGVLVRADKDLAEHDVRPKVLFRLGLVSGRTEDWNTAERALAELARGWPDFAQKAEAELWRGRALLAMGRERPAQQAFERAVASDPGRIAAQARLELGRMDQAAGRPDEALSQFLKVALLYGHEEEVAEALFRAGECLAAQGADEKAHEQWRELCRDHPDTSWAAQARGLLEGAQSF